MVTTLLNAVNRMLTHEDFGKFLLRLAVGGLMLFHGLHKLFDGVDGISNMLIAKGLPGFIAYGVLVGEVDCALPDCAGYSYASCRAGAGIDDGGGVVNGRHRENLATGCRRRMGDRKFSLFLYWRAGGGVSGGGAVLCCGKFGLAVKNCRMAA